MWTPINHSSHCFYVFTSKSIFRENNAKYFTVIGGVAALLSDKVKSSEIIAYEDLGAEALYKLYVEKFPIKVELS